MEGAKYIHVLWPFALVSCEAASPAVPPAVEDSGVARDSAASVVETGTGDETASASEAGPGGEDGGLADAGALAAADAGADAASDATTAAACSNLFCEDFEQGQIDPTVWDLQTGGAGTADVQGQTVAHGRYAMHVNGTGSSSDFALIITKNAPASLQGVGPVFGRANLFVSTTINSVHTGLLFAGTPGFPKLNYMEVGEFGSGSWQLGFVLFNPAPSVAPGFVEEDSYPPGHDAIPLGKWSCIEWKFGDAPDAMLLWVDGTQIDQFDSAHIDYTSGPRSPGSVLNGKNSGIIGGFAVFGFGFHAWHPSNAFDIFYDDIALDTKRVGCLP